MKLVCQTKLHFREGNSDKVYEVDLCEVGEKFVVNFRYGRSGSTLKEGTKTTNPVEFEEAQKIFDKLVNEKSRKGYHIVGEKTESVETSQVTASHSIDNEERNQTILDKLKDNKAKSNPKISRIIWRAGELKLTDATPHLIDLIGTGDDLRDYCIAWSLGFCGDETTIPALVNFQNHKAEFVQRIAREAIFKLADDTGKNKLREESISKFPESLQILITNGTAEALENALREKLGKQEKGSFDDITKLYEIDNEIIRPVLLQTLRETPFIPRYFKPVRHIYKIAEYRHDAEVFGIIAKKFETEKALFYTDSWSDWIYLQYKDGTWEHIKSVKKELKRENSRIAFSNKTKDYFQRRSWRTLRRLGEIGDLDYVRMAVGSLLEYSDSDAREPAKLTIYDYYHTGRYDWRNPLIKEIHWDKFSPYLLFNQILYKNSPRYELKIGSRGFRMREGYKVGGETPNVREEAFPELWNDQPKALLHLLAESRCLPVHEFAVKALKDCKDFVEKLDTEAIIMLVSAPYDVTAQFGFELAIKIYDEANPNVELAVGVATCESVEARQKAFTWIDKKRELFATNNSAMLKLLSSKHSDTREFAAKLLKSTNYTETEAKNLIGLLIAEMVNFDDEKSEIIKDVCNAMLESFGKNLRTLNFAIIEDLLSHNNLEVQKFGGQILLNHKTSAENLSNDLINSLIRSEFEEIRSIGIKLFGQFSDENLLKREKVILELLSHELVDVHNSTRPIVLNLAQNHPQFVENISYSIFISLLVEEKHEGVHSRFLSILKELPNWTKFADIETAKLLVNADYVEAKEAGGLILQNRADDWSKEFSTAEIVEFTNNEILSIRQTSWKLAEKTSEKLRDEVSYLIRALDAKWFDSREFWREFFRKNLTAQELTPEILVSICDSVKDETQKFGRDLLLHYFEEENGVEYLLKLSEHPSPEMQLFATNYLENYATDSPEKLEKLSPYFTRVLSLVNRSRVAKDRVLKFIESEALKDETSAKLVAKILARQSATVAIGDKAAMIQSMLKICREFPNIELPIKVNQTEVRSHVV